MFDCVPPFLILIAPCSITTPLVEPPPTPREVVISVADGKPTVTVAVSEPLPLTSISLDVPAIVET